MPGGIPSTLRKLVRLVEETRTDLSVASEAEAAILHRLDEHSRCLRAILRIARHVHGMLALVEQDRNEQRARSSRVGKKPPRGVH